MEDTRRILMEATFKQIYQFGYKGTSLDMILDSCNLTKGALYHHFKSKKSVTLEALEVILRKFFDVYWVQPIEKTDTPYDTLIDRIDKFAHAEVFDHAFISVKHGCLLNNLIQEMAPIDEDFSTLLLTLYTIFEDSILKALTKAQEYGEIRDDVNVKDAAVFVTASVEACITTARLRGNLKSYSLCTHQLKFYLRSLRP